jgi:broad specificity phosphatase PhoE
VGELAWLAAIRHGESTANVAGEYAERRCLTGLAQVPAHELAGLEELEIAERDADVPLSPAGEAQSRALSGWLAGQDLDLVLSSPYRRAVQTAELAVPGVPVRLDERLRDRELGVIELLTRYGIEKRYPQEAARRERLGEFYYRPPGGEAWTDIALRLRTLLDDLRRDHAGQRVLVFAHEAVVFLLRYLIEEQTEAEVRELSAARLRNASVTIWARVDGRLRLATFNDSRFSAPTGG